MLNEKELNDIKEKIHNETGVPIVFLDGENEEENRSRALALMAFKKEYSEKLNEGLDVKINQSSKRKSNSEQFAEWMNDQLNDKSFL